MGRLLITHPSPALTTSIAVPHRPCTLRRIRCPAGSPVWHRCKCLADPGALLLPALGVTEWTTTSRVQQCRQCVARPATATPRVTRPSTITATATARVRATDEPRAASLVCLSSATIPILHRHCDQRRQRSVPSRTATCVSGPLRRTWTPPALLRLCSNPPVRQTRRRTSAFRACPWMALR